MRWRSVSVGMPCSTVGCCTGTGRVTGGRLLGAGRPRGTPDWQPLRISAAAPLAARQLVDARCGIADASAMYPAPMNASLPPGLYIVATPIGNLGDLSPRAAEVLANAAVIAVEDSRVTAGLLRHIGDKRPMTPYHDHNAEAVRPGLIARMGHEAVAVVSDAGTPLISDPGYKLVREARAAGHNVVTIPGPCAAVAALTLAGLPTDRFLFVGFLPSKAMARDEAIAEIGAIRATLVLYESGPRLAATLAALAAGLGDREAAVPREPDALSASDAYAALA